MDRDQRKDLENEQTPQEDDIDIRPDDGPVDDMRYYLSLLKAIRQTINGGKGFRRYKFVDVEQCNDILDDLDKNLPVAIQYGRRMYDERERILGVAEDEARDRITTAEMRARKTLDDAQKHADRILADANEEANSLLADAKQRADYMVSDDEILRRAQEEAQVMKNNAAIQISEDRLKSSHEMLQLVRGVETELTEALERVSRQRQKLDEEVK